MVLAAMAIYKRKLVKMKKKTLIGLFRLVGKYGYLLFVPKKKKPQNQFYQGLHIAQVTITKKGPKNMPNETKWMEPLVQGDVRSGSVALACLFKPSNSQVRNRATQCW